MSSYAFSVCWVVFFIVLPNRLCNVFSYKFTGHFSTRPPTTHDPSEEVLNKDVDEPTTTVCWNKNSSHTLRVVLKKI